VKMGMNAPRTSSQKKKWWSFGVFVAPPLVETTLTTEVPIDVAIEKLRGFVSDHKARIISIRDKRVELEMTSEHIGHFRRQADRPAPYRIELEFSEQRQQKSNTFGLAAGAYAQTVAAVTIRPKRRRNRRRDDQFDRAKLILQSLKAYLMASEAESTSETAQTAAAAR